MSTDTGTPRRRRARRPPRVVNRIVLRLLRSPLHAVLDPGICELRYRGRRSGRTIALPVIYAGYGEKYVVVVGDSADKRWWRTFTEPWPVEVRQGGRLRGGTCRVVADTDPAYGPAWQAYSGRQHVSRIPGDRLLLIDFHSSPGEAS